MKNNIRHAIRSINFRIMGSFVGIFFVYFILSSVISNNIYENGVKNKIYSVIQKEVTLISGIIKDKISTIEDIPFYIQKSNMLKDYFKIDPNNTELIKNAKIEIFNKAFLLNHEFLNLSGQNYINIKSITIYGKNGITINSLGDMNISKYSYSDIIHDDLFKSLLENNIMNTWKTGKSSLFNISSNTNNIVYLSSINWGGVDPSYNSIVVINVQEYFFNNLYLQAKSDIEGFSFIFDKNANIISSDGSTTDEIILDASLIDKLTQVDSTYLTTTFLGKESALFTHRIDLTDWYFAKAVPVSYINADINQQKGYNFIIFIAIMVILSIISSLISSSILKPIKTFARHIKEVKKGNINLKIEITRNDEFSIIEENFNEMLDRIQRLLDEIIENNQRIKKSEFRALQAQINPHFFYNALDLAYWNIIIGDYDKSKDVILWLGKFFRYGLNGGKTLTTLANEIEHVSNYLNISKTRFDGNIEFTIIMDPEIGKYKCVKLILQPLVENSIIHGIRPKVDGGFIFINVILEDDNILLEVYDNGVGIDKNLIDKLLNGEFVSIEENNINGGLALRNIKERLDLYYGSRYKLKIMSEKNKYTIIQISIPKILNESELIGGIENVPNFID